MSGSEEFHTEHMCIMCSVPSKYKKKPPYYSTKLYGLRGISFSDSFWIYNNDERNKKKMAR